MSGHGQVGSLCAPSEEEEWLREFIAEAEQVGRRLPPEEGASSGPLRSRRGRKRKGGAGGSARDESGIEGLSAQSPEEGGSASGAGSKRRRREEREGQRKGETIEALVPCFRTIEETLGLDVLSVSTSASQNMTPVCPKDFEEREGVVAFAFHVSPADGRVRAKCSRCARKERGAARDACACLGKIALAEPSPLQLRAFGGKSMCALVRDPEITRSARHVAP